MPPHSAARRRPRPPLTPTSLNELALSYVGRFATSRAKLASYLKRKLRERGWDGTAEPDPQAIAERMAELGYIDDRAFASSKARSLLSRGYGERRVGDALHAAGIADADGADARRECGEGAVDAAVRFARRRRIGPFAEQIPDQAARQKMIAAMLRAGHRMELARRIVAMEPGSQIDPDSLRDG
jgi:regulatory protein